MRLNLRRVRAIALLTALQFAAPAARAELTIVPIAPPSGALEPAPAALNSRGTVLLQADPTASWLRFPDGTYTPAGVPAGYSFSQLAGINNHDVSVGYARAGSTTMHAVIRDAAGNYLFPLQGQSSAQAINDAGTIIGTDASSSPARMFVWRPSTGISYVPSPPGSSPGATSRLAGINNAETVIGATGVPPPNPQPGVSLSRAFRYTAATGSALLPTVGSDPTEAADINDANVIVGTVGGSGSSIRAAMWLPDTTLVELIPPSSTGIVTAQGINNRGDIVGSGFLGGPRALLWSSDLGNIDLNTLLSPDQRLHWDLRVAYDINDDRQVLGTGQFDADGPGGPLVPQLRLFLLNIPEPATGATALSALLLCARPRRGRFSR